MVFNSAKRLMCLRFSLTEAVPPVYTSWFVSSAAISRNVMNRSNIHLYSTSYGPSVLEQLFPVPSLPQSALSPSHFPGVSSESTGKLQGVLKDNHTKWHIFFNEKRFHKWVGSSQEPMTISNNIQFKPRCASSYRVLGARRRCLCDPSRVRQRLWIWEKCIWIPRNYYEYKFQWTYGRQQVRSTLLHWLMLVRNEIRKGTSMPTCNFSPYTLRLSKNLFFTSIKFGFRHPPTRQATPDAQQIPFRCPSPFDSHWIWCRI